jgi:hypothetical protein
MRRKIKEWRARLSVRMVKAATEVLSLAEVVRGSNTSPIPLPAPAPAAASELPEAVIHLVTSPELASRRVEFNIEEIMQLLWSALHRNGAPVSELTRGRWIWVGNPHTGQPHLFFIRPGIES